ncbi:hypothetical protein [Aliikangiella coralliicola]|uniref:Uncharacterized protein n=1 Tax=Aliikangiella coralliicola TaxID=2592383 RepID=A0A545UI15_9GAMM|nr:hypothetical protein [Aliikangiella coralliicola]TQV89111.1 hypothetical protein FLL46_03010 [Aliikangiella coralliicola]
MIEKNNLVVKYYNLKMFLTTDLNTFMKVLINEYGAIFNVEYREMNENEQRESSYIQDGITLVKDRFWLLESLVTSTKRRKDLEAKIIDEGQK